MKLSRYNELYEVAAYIHKVWCNWVLYMLTKGIENKDGSVTIPAEYVRRWERQMMTDFSDLPFSEAYSDIEIANVILDKFYEKKDEKS